MSVQTRSRSRQDLMVKPGTAAFPMQCLTVCQFAAGAAAAAEDHSTGVKTFSWRTILQASQSLDFVLSLEKCKILIALKGMRRSPGFLANMIPDTSRFFSPLSKNQFLVSPKLEEIQKVSVVKQKACALAHLQSKLLFRCCPYHEKKSTMVFSPLPPAQQVFKERRENTPRIKILCCKEHCDLNHPEISCLHKRIVLSKLLFC